MNMHILYKLSQINTKSNKLWLTSQKRIHSRALYVSGLNRGEMSPILLRGSRAVTSPGGFKWNRANSGSVVFLIVPLYREPVSELCGQTWNTPFYMTTAGTRPPPARAAAQVQLAEVNLPASHLSTQ